MSPHLHCSDDQGTTFPPLVLEYPARRELPGSFRVGLKPMEFGEAYQVLLCCLLVKNSELSISVNFHKSDPKKSREEQAKEQKAIDEIKDLFRWFGFAAKDKPLQSITTKTGRDGHDGKTAATEVIRAAFKACQKVHYQNRHKMHLHQDQLFLYIRVLLSERVQEYTKGLRHEKIQLLPEYFEPSYAAKYWVNRYFRLTSDPARVPKVAHRNWLSLPKYHDIGKMAIIHIRRTPKSDVGRVMTKKMLEHVAHSIVNANKVCRQAMELTKYEFSHVMLYGDLTSQEAIEWKLLFEEYTKGENLSVSFLSRPWEDRSKDPTLETNNDVKLLWEKFRDFAFGHLPIQVKVLSIWVLFCERYGPDVCVIGHRSGFIEGAALAGIPVFYLNNERKDIAKGAKENTYISKSAKSARRATRPQASEYMAPRVVLWRAAGIGQEERSVQDRVEQYGVRNRLRMLSDVMNTLIPIEVLEKQGDQFVLDENYKHELAAALFTFMCSRAQPLGLEPTLEATPAWTLRVYMMHDEGETKEDGLLEAEDSTGTRGIIPLGEAQGPRWLQQRCHFAFHFLEESKEPRPFLPPCWVNHENIRFFPILEDFEFTQEVLAMLLANLPGASSEGSERKEWDGEKEESEEMRW